MKNYQDIKNNLAKLNELDQKKVKDIINDLEKYTQKSQINQEGLKSCMIYKHKLWFLVSNTPTDFFSY